MSNGLKEDICTVLRKPLASFTRQGTGGTFRYHKGADVIKRLNEAFGHSWSSEKLEVQTIEEQVLMLVSVTVYSDGDVISHQGYGSADIVKSRKDSKIVNIGNTYKSAFTNALKKAAEQFGIGLEEEEEQNVRSQVPAAAAKTNYTPRPPMSRPTGSTMQTRPSMGGRPPMSAGPSSVPASIPASAPTVTTAAAYAAKVATQRQPTTMPEMPSPAPPRIPVAVSTPPVNPPPMVSPSTTGELINGIQETALLNIITMKNLKETDVVTGALPKSGKVTFKELLRVEAVEVIKYANVQPQGSV